MNKPHPVEEHIWTKLAGIFLIKNKQVWTWVFCQSEHLAMLQAATDLQIHHPDTKYFTKKQIK